jgi:hypothetical protein
MSYNSFCYATFLVNPLFNGYDGIDSDTNVLCDGARTASHDQHLSSETPHISQYFYGLETWKLLTTFFVKLYRHCYPHFKRRINVWSLSKMTRHFSACNFILFIGIDPKQVKNKFPGKANICFKIPICSDGSNIPQQTICMRVMKAKLSLTPLKCSILIFHFDVRKKNCNFERSNRTKIVHTIAVHNLSLLNHK